MLGIGHLLLTTPILLIIFILPIGIFSDFKGLGQILKATLSYALAIVVIWYWWNYLVIRWQVWAFKNISEDSWIEFKRNELPKAQFLLDFPPLALQRFRRTEDLRELRKINKKIAELLELELIQLELSLPNEICYKANRGDILFILILCLGLLLAISLFLEGSFGIGFVLCILSLLLFTRIDHLSYFLKSECILRLTKKEIIVQKEKFPWSTIEKIRVLKSEMQLLIFVKTKDSKIDDIKKISLEHLKIGDIELFIQQIRVFADRYSLNI